jgi:hypothetical protein
VLAPCNRSLRKRTQVPTILIFALILSSLGLRLRAQSDSPRPKQSSGDQITYVKELYDAGRWEAVIQAAEARNDELPELELYRGLALAHLQRWDDARKAFEIGLARSPRDTRFLDELAGTAYKQNRWSPAKGYLRRSLAIHPTNAYADDFLASIYLLEGNLEAALKYWGRVGKPQFSDLSFVNRPRINPIILDRAFEFSRGSQWSASKYLTTLKRLEKLDLLASMRFGLQPQADGSFSLTFDSVETNPWGNSKWQGVLSLLRGVPYQTVYPEFYDLNHSGVNWLSMVRWDAEKRRLYSEIAAPLEKDPARRYKVCFDARNENWNLTTTFLPGTSAPAALNLQKVELGADIESIPSGLWSWSAGVLYSDRWLRNLQGISPGAGEFFTNTSSLSTRIRIDRFIVRFPERRFTLESGAIAQVGTFFESPLTRYARIQGRLTENWLPRSRGDDYETSAELRGGWTSGNVPFDELFVLGFDRDTDLWMRGHPGLVSGEKGRAPMGRNYVLANLDTSKIVYAGSLMEARVGPFLDSGRVYDRSPFFGSPKWMWDTGIQAKIRIVGSLEFFVGYGKDLRTGNNSFFTTVSK